MKTSEVVLGFTNRPGPFCRRAFLSAAKELGISLQFCDLSLNDRIRWERLDALILPGGPDIDPRYYMHELDPELREHTKKNMAFYHQTAKGRRRDAFEHGLLMELFHNKAISQIPVLGICRGMQMLAVAQGIPLYLDLKLETGMISSRYEYIPVNVIAGSRLHQILGETQFHVFKGQRQAIRLPYLNSHQERWPRLKVSAFSHKNKVAEAIEFEDRPIIGVQFHSELSLDEAPKKIFTWLLSEAYRRAEVRKVIFEREFAY